MTHLDSQEGPGSSQGPHRRGQVRHGDVQTETELGPARWERLEGQQAGACGMEEGGRSRWGCLQRGRRPADTPRVAPYIHSGLPTSKTMVTIHLRRLIQPWSQQQRVGNTQGPWSHGGGVDLGTASLGVFHRPRVARFPRNPKSHCVSSGSVLRHTRYLAVWPVRPRLHVYS